MNAQQAIALVTEWIRWHDVDYPVEGLVADRFVAGWNVHAPVDVDTNDPMAILDMPDRPVFLVGDSGRIEEVSSAVPQQQLEEEFSAAESAIRERSRVPGFDPELVLDTEVNSRRLVVDAGGSPMATGRSRSTRSSGSGTGIPPPRAALAPRLPTPTGISRSEPTRSARRT
jgi:hypothetical protein